MIGDAAGVEHRDLLVVDVHADDVVPVTGETARGDAADISETEDTDVHDTVS